jgi:hypothetical protein
MEPEPLRQLDRELGHVLEVPGEVRLVIGEGMEQRVNRAVARRPPHVLLRVQALVGDGQRIPRLHGVVR